MIRAILVDDEERAITSLRITIEKYCKEVQIIGTAKNISEAKEIINRLNPQVVFLDINLPDGSGIDLLQSFKGADFKVIFVTAYDKYVIQALRLSAFDYLMKPVDKDDLVQCVDRLKDELLSEFTEKFKVLSSYLDNSNHKRIAINTIEGLDVIDIQEILFLSSNSNYTDFHLTDRKLVSSKPIGTYEDLFDEFLFYRIHRSYLVNKEHIRAFKRKESVVVLTNGQKLEVSKRKKEELLSKLQGF